MVNSVALEEPHRWKYVDDITTAEPCKPSLHPPGGTQRTLDTVNREAAEAHMILNVEKCAVMQCSVAVKKPPALQIVANGKTVPSVSSLPFLGVTLTPSLKWDVHIDNVIRKSNSKRYFLVVLRRAGVSLKHLVQFYTTFIRPSLEYAAPVWHPGLPQNLSDGLEAVQRLCLKTILPELNYGRALETTGLHPLVQRREDLCLNFARIAHSSADFKSWFPPPRQHCHSYHLRNSHTLSISRCRTDRLKSSPINYLSRLLNAHK